MKRPTSYELEQLGYLDEAEETDEEAKRRGRDLLEIWRADEEERQRNRAARQRKKGSQ